jgi:hypothetical protein
VTSWAPSMLICFNYFLASCDFQTCSFHMQDSLDKPFFTCPFSFNLLSTSLTTCCLCDCWHEPGLPLHMFLYFFGACLFMYYMTKCTFEDEWSFPQHYARLGNSTAIDDMLFRCFFFSFLTNRINLFMFDNRSWRNEESTRRNEKPRSSIPSKYVARSCKEQ